MCPHVLMGHEWLAMARVSKPVIPTSQFLIALTISNLIDMSRFHQTRVWRVKTIASNPLDMVSVAFDIAQVSSPYEL